MQIKSKHANLQNGKSNMPIDGEVEIKNGIVVVSDELGNLLLGNPNDWELIDELDELEELDEESDDLESSNDDEYGIEKMELPEMIQLAKDANLKGYNLFTKDVKKMRAFLRKKLKTNIDELNKLVDQKGKV